MRLLGLLVATVALSGLAANSETAEQDLHLASPGTGISTDPSLDFDGRWLTFATTNTELTGVPDDYCDAETAPGSCAQIVLRDLATGNSTVVSRDHRGSPGRSPSKTPQLGHDGHVVFQSYAALLPESATMANLFWVKGADLRPVNVGLDGGIAVAEKDPADPSYGTVCRIWCGAPSAAAGSNVVAFSSWSSNLVPGDTNRRPDVFLRNVETGETVLISRAVNGSVGNDASFENSAGDYVSADGSRVVFTSAAIDLVAAKNPPCPDSTRGWPYQVHGCPQVYLRDLQRNETRLISKGDGGEPGNALSTAGVISDDGRWAAYITSATNIVGSGGTEVVLVDLERDAQSIISRTSNGTLSNGEAGWLAIDADGSRVAFVTNSMSLGSPNGAPALHLYDRPSNKVIPVSLSDVGSAPKGYVHSMAISGDGKTIAFSGVGSGWMEGVSGANIYVRHVPESSKTAFDKGGPPNIPIAVLLAGLALIGLGIWLRKPFKRQR